MVPYNKLLVVVIGLLVVGCGAFAQCAYPPTSSNVISHRYYSLEYSEQHEQAKWVCHKLTRRMIRGTVDRTDNFRADRKVTTGSASLSDYKGSGFDRGHLAPAADFSFNAVAMSESFLMSNMSPQVPSFNRGAWRRVESLVREWAQSYIILHVVTGPIFSPTNRSIGNGVSIPSAYYKAVFTQSGQNPRAIGFIMPNQKIDGALQSYAVSIDDIERRTGLDLFPQLDDDTERKIESSLNVSQWKWSANRTYSNQQTVKKKPNTSEKRLTTSVQCKGITKKGARCKNRTLNRSGYCHVHDK